MFEGARKLLARWQQPPRDARDDEIEEGSMVDTRILSSSRHVSTGRAKAGEPAVSHEVVRSEEVYVVRPEGPQRVVIFEPPTATATAATGLRRPCVVFFHGGGWRRGDIRQFEPFARDLAHRGIVTMTPAYRLLPGEEDAIPLAAEEDARAAIAWARANADRYAIDPTRIGAGGGSSGAHLALMAAMLEARSGVPVGRPDLLLLMNAPLDFDGYTTSVPLEERRAHSPLHLLDASLPPTLLVHGTEDRVIPYQQVLDFQERAMRSGIEGLVVVPFEGRGHGFFNLGKGRAGDQRQVMATFVRFLQKQQWLS